MFSSQGSYKLYVQGVIRDVLCQTLTLNQCFFVRIHEHVYKYLVPEILLTLGVEYGYVSIKQIKKNQRTLYFLEFHFYYDNI